MLFRSGRVPDCGGGLPIAGSGGYFGRGPERNSEVSVCPLAGGFAVVAGGAAGGDRVDEGWVEELERVAGIGSQSQGGCGDELSFASLSLSLS